MAAFLDRLHATIGERGYEPGMRRSIQTVIIYEAHRCIADRLPSMRPFQRKAAFWDQAQALLEATGFLPHQRKEIMWRTGTSQEPMLADTAWKRVKLIEKELDKLAESVKPFCCKEKSHDDTVNEYLQQQYEQQSGVKGKPPPAKWEHVHNNVIMTYRMYYNGSEPDPNFPKAVPIKEVIVPKNKEASETNFFELVPARNNVYPNSDGLGVARGASFGSNATMPRDGVPGAAHMPHSSPYVLTETAEDRRAILQEIRLHMDLLNEFTGIIPDEELIKRKQVLFQSLPMAPSPVQDRLDSHLANNGDSNKRPRLSEQGQDGH